MYNPDEDRKEYEFNEDPLRDQIENSTWIIEIKILYSRSTLPFALSENVIYCI